MRETSVANGYRIVTREEAAMGIKPVNVRQVPELNVSIAFITDPWGTYIELTEGLDKIE